MVLIQHLHVASSCQTSPLWCDSVLKTPRMFSNIVRNLSQLELFPKCTANLFEFITLKRTSKSRKILIYATALLFSSLQFRSASTMSVELVQRLNLEDSRT